MHNDNQQPLKDKLEGFQQTPHDKVWNRIREGLHQHAEQELHHKLDSFTQEPNHSMWRRIQQGLHERAEAPIKEQLNVYAQDPNDIIWSNISERIAIEKFHKQSIWITRVAAVLILLCLVYRYATSVTEKHDYFTNTDNKFQNKKESTDSSIKNLDGESVRKEVNSLKDSNKPFTTESNQNVKTIREQELQGNTLTYRNQTTKSNKNKEFSIKDTVHAKGKGLLVEVPGASNHNLSNDPITITPQNKLQDQRSTNTIVMQEASSLDEFKFDNTLSNAYAQEHISNAYVNGFIKHKDTIPNEVFHKNEVLNISEYDFSTTVVFTIAPPVPVNDTITQKDQLLTSHVQDEEENKTHSDRTVSLYFIAMPTFGYNQIQPKKDDDILIESLHRVSDFSGSRLGFRAEVGIEKRLTEKWSFNAGLLFYKRKQTFEYTYIVPGESKVQTTDNNSFDYFVEPSKHTDTLTFEVKNVGITISTNYLISDKRFNQKLGAGLELHHGLKTLNQISQGNSSLYLFSHLYYRATFKINDRLDFMTQPTINYSFIVTEKLEAPFYIKPYGLGLNLGLEYKL